MDVGRSCVRTRVPTVTVSTSGIVPAMLRLREQLPQVALAVSLHAPNNALRVLVPINKKYPLEQLMDVCAMYYAGMKKREITYEYVMLDGVNDSQKHAIELKKLLRKAPGKINLITFNPFQEQATRPVQSQPSKSFQCLRDDYVTTVRTTRGDDISAACGQLGDILIAPEKVPVDIVIAS